MNSVRSDLLVLAVVLALAGGCANRAAHGAGAAASLGSAGEVTSAADRARLEELAAARGGGRADRGYLIGPDDLLEIHVPDLLEGRPGLAWARPPSSALPAVAEAPTTQRGFRVSAAGDIALPLIGAVRAEGLTPMDLERAIAQRLTAEGILRDPQVGVQIVEFRSQVVAVVGSVERPGLYPLTRPRATLADLVWGAGGPSKEAGRVVEFVPAATEPARPIRIDLEVLLRATGSPQQLFNPPVLPGDVITIAPAGSVLVDGWVGRPGSYPITRGLTVSGAVAAAGGNLFPADRHRATLRRVLAPGEERSYPIDLEAVADGRASDVPITDGDVVQLPVSAPRLVPWGMWMIVRDLVRVGGNAFVF